MTSDPLRSLGAALLDLLYPPHCEVCDTPGPDALCPACRAQIQRHQPPECSTCGALLPPTAGRGLCEECAGSRRYYKAARSVAIHTGALRSAIIQFKFNNRRRLQAPLAQLLADRITAEPDPPQGLPLRSVDWIVPVPLHPRRKQWRGFDQAYLLALELSRLTNLPLVQALARTRPTTPQLQLARGERETNVRDAFAPLGVGLEGKRVLLVDDVFTTGATANQAARAARAGGAAEVYVLTISRPAPGWHPAAMTLEPGDA